MASEAHLLHCEEQAGVCAREFSSAEASEESPWPVLLPDDGTEVEELLTEASPSSNPKAFPSPACSAGASSPSETEFLEDGRSVSEAAEGDPCVVGDPL